MKQTNILVTGVGSPGAYGTIRSLRRAPGHFRIIGMDANPDAAGARWADQFFVTEPATNERFVESVLALCRNQQISVILPLVTRELYPLSVHRHQFIENGTVPAVSSRAALLHSNHKGRLLLRLKSSGIPVPDYRVVNTVDEFKSALKALGYPHVPVCFKPVYGDGGRGFHVLDNTLDRFDTIFRQKPDSTYISYRELLQVLAETDEVLPELLVMEFLPGTEYSVDLLVSKGRALVAIPRLREATSGGLTVRGRIVQAEDVIQYSTRVVESLGLNGNVGVQVRRNREGLPRIVEVNPRLQGTTVHSAAAGVNLPYLGVKLALQIPIHTHELAVKWETSMVRYWEEVYYDADGLPYAF